MKNLKESGIILLKIAHLSLGKNVIHIRNREIWDAFYLGIEYQRQVNKESDTKNER